MILYLKKVRELLKKFVRVHIRYIPRAENSRADALEKLATASQEDLDRLTSVEHLSEPSVDLNNEEIYPVMSELSRTLGYYHRTTGTQFRLAFHSMQVWYPESPGVR